MDYMSHEIIDIISMIVAFFLSLSLTKEHKSLVAEAYIGNGYCRWVSEET
jgi:hypothetical protein